MTAESRSASMDIVIPCAPEGRDLLCNHVRIAVDHYLRALNGSAPNGLYEMVLQEIERPLLEVVLEHCGHNQSKAAQVLGLSRSTLRKKMAQHGLA
ncbi:helix-turn-helix domain-containing protein [Methylotetracoccus oryzae]